jgi:hypothetical protein
MKTFRIAAALVALIILLGVVPAFATDDEAPADTPPVETPAAPVVVVDSGLSDAVTALTDLVTTLTTPPEPTHEPLIVPADEPLTASSVEVVALTTTLTEPIPPEPDAEPTLASTVTALLGSYTPRTQTVTAILSDGSTVTYEEYVQGLAGVDWEWMSGAVLFTAFLWSIFRMIGSVIGRV